MPVQEKRLRLLGFPFEEKDLQKRVGPVTKNKDKGICFFYLDARAVSDRLDQVCGPANWKARYFPGPTPESVTCALAINVEYENGDTEWVEKEDGAGDNSDVEAQKAAYSNSLRRTAAAGWGVGRILYEIPNAWHALKDGSGFFAEPEKIHVPKEFLAQPLNTATWAEHIAPMIERESADEAKLKAMFKKKFGDKAVGLLDAIIFAEDHLHECV